jgi:hypothetical protein
VLKTAIDHRWRRVNKLARQRDMRCAFPLLDMPALVDQCTDLLRRKNPFGQIGAFLLELLVAQWNFCAADRLLDERRRLSKPGPWRPASG